MFFNKKLLYYFHYIVPISILCLPLLPVKYLKYGILYLLILQISWIFFDGCVITNNTKSLTNNKSFMLDFYNKYISKKIDSTMSHRLNQLIVSTVLVICAYKFLYYCNLYGYNYKK